MSRPAAKLVEARDPFIGRRVRVLRGDMSGREGRIISAFRGRMATPDRFMVMIEAGAGIRSLLLADFEVLP